MVVICVGLYRSGSTWQYQIAADLVERHRDGHRHGFVDSLSPESGTWDVVKLHDPDDTCAERLRQGQALGLYIYRDLRDVAFSLMHKANRTFDEMIAEQRLQACI